jgi:hypothetical protein
MVKSFRVPLAQKLSGLEGRGTEDRKMSMRAARWLAIQCLCLGWQARQPSPGTRLELLPARAEQELRHLAGQPASGRAAVVRGEDEVLWAS